LNAEEKPLVVATGVGVDAHNQIKLTTLDHECFVKIATFKVRVKNIGVLAKRDLLIPGICLYVRIQAGERSDLRLPLFLKLVYGVKDIFLGRKLDVVASYI
jgi:hypothetical protein